MRLGGTNGGLTGQWLLYREPAIQILTHRHSRESRWPEDWELKKDVCQGVELSVLNRVLCMSVHWWWSGPFLACGPSLSLGWASTLTALGPHRTASWVSLGKPFKCPLEVGAMREQDQKD